MKWKETPDQEFLICMGFDAMRAAMGLKPQNYSIHEIATWVQCICQRTSKGGQMSDIQDEAYSEAMDEIERLKALITQAANVLECLPKSKQELIHPFVTKLRKAAQ